MSKTITINKTALANAGKAMFAAARNEAMAHDMLAKAFTIARKGKIDFSLIRRDYVAGFWTKRHIGELSDTITQAAYAFADSAGTDAKKLADGQKRRTKSEETLHASARKAWSRALSHIGEAAIDNRGKGSATSPKAKAKRQVKAGEVKAAERTPEAIQKAVAEIVAPPNATKATQEDFVASFAHLNNSLMASGKKHAKDCPPAIASAIAQGTALIAKAISDWRVETHSGAQAETENA